MRDIIEKFNKRLAWICGFIGLAWAIVAFSTIVSDNKEVWGVAVFCGIMASLYGGYLYAKLDKWFNEEKNKYE
jgi:hypothetical protein